MVVFRGLLFSLLALTSTIAVAEVDFQTDIRPLLSDRCFKCHGFDDEKREADLGLHLFEEATRDLGGYQAIKPGDADASEVLHRLISDDPDNVMPPPDANKPKFSEAEVDLIRRWINSGAKFEKHWAFEKPIRPELPQGGESKRHPVDQFLDREIESSEIAVNSEADPYTLVRRLSYDLRGIPPTVAEADAFVSAYEKDRESAWSNLVDAFLDSPAYGQKWAREWLDLARYADSNGYEKDRPRSIWPYRDWVVDALQADMPYDQFTIEQLAGDMLPNPTQAQLIATGFNRNTMLNEEGGIDPLEFRFHAMVDRVATTGSVWMGLTTGCAQCHTHKFDPITHTDYFALFALLNNADEPEMEVEVPELVKTRAELDAKIEALEKEAFKNVKPGAYEAWLEQRKQEAVVWTSLKPLEATSNLPLLEIEDDDAIFASGDFTKRDVYDVKLDLSPHADKNITAIRIEVMPDKRLPAGGPGTAYYEGRSGDFFLSEVKAKADGVPVEFSEASVSFGKLAVGSGKAEGANIFDGDGSTGWSTATQAGKGNELVINLKSPLSGQKTLDLNLLFERHFVAALGKFRVSVTTLEAPVNARANGVPNPHDIPDWLMRKHYLASTPGMKTFQDQIAALEKRKPKLPTTLVFRERPEHNPRVTRRHHRGEYMRAKEEVAPAVPVIFEPIPEGQPQNRLGLARWLVSDRNPLAARVAVNRAWRSFFGTGILETSGDFGYQSNQPSHPELLDWLATEFVANGWSTKSLHRLIVTTEAYRRDSRIESTQLEQDPDNRLLARGPRFRLTGEMLRDGALQSAGLLSLKEGGPGVYPPQPDSVAALAYGKSTWTHSKGEDRYRRSLYTFVKRTAPFAAYLAFDGPTGESCIPRRDRSNTPLQALTLLNDEMFAEAAEAIAHETGLGEGLNPVESSRAPREKIESLFRKILTRPPTERESSDLVDYYKTQIERLGSGDLNAGDILESGEPEKENANEIAALKMVARVLLNVNEFITKG